MYNEERKFENELTASLNFGCSPVVLGTTELAQRVSQFVVASLNLQRALNYVTHRQALQTLPCNVKVSFTGTRNTYSWKLRSDSSFKFTSERTANCNLNRTAQEAVIR
jgi:hypothetical protein